MYLFGHIRSQLRHIKSFVAACMLFSIRGMWAAEHAGSVVVAPGPTSPTKNQTCISLHWKADSQPPEHRRNPFIFKLYLVSFLFFGHALQLEGSYFPDQELNLWPQQCKGRVLTTGLSGKSLLTRFQCLTSRTIR